MVGIDLAEAAAHHHHILCRSSDVNTSSHISPAPVAFSNVIFCFRMKNLLLLATLTLTASLATAAPQNGFLSGLTSAFNNFFGGSGKLDKIIIFRNT